MSKIKGLFSLKRLKSTNEFTRSARTLNLNHVTTPEPSPGQRSDSIHCRVKSYRNVIFFCLTDSRLKRKEKSSFYGKFRSLIDSHQTKSPVSTWSSSLCSCSAWTHHQTTRIQQILLQSEALSLHTTEGSTNHRQEPERQNHGVLILSVRRGQRSKTREHRHITDRQVDRQTGVFETPHDSSNWFDLIDWLIWSAVTREVGQTSDRLSDVFKSRRKTGNSCHKNNFVFQQHSPDRPIRAQHGVRVFHPPGDRLRHLRYRQVTSDRGQRSNPEAPVRPSPEHCVPKVRKLPEWLQLNTNPPIRWTWGYDVTTETNQMWLY